jgi:hypothetical protein
MRLGAERVTPWPANTRKKKQAVKNHRLFNFRISS